MTSFKQNTNRLSPEIIRYIKNIFGAGGNTFESKTFVLSADGTDITGSDAGITLEVSGAAAKIRIPTTKTLKLAHINVKTPTDSGSNGTDNGIIANSISLAPTAGLSIAQTVSINVDALGDGWTGKITIITSTYFEITFTQVGAGLAITGQMHLIEG